MFKSTLGVVLLLAFAGAYAQHNKTSHSGGQSHGGAASHATRSSGGGSSHGTRSSGGGSHGSSHGSTGSHHGTHSGTHHGTHHGTRGGSHGGGRNVSLRPGGMGHPRDWFEHQHWMEGPAYQSPQFSCYQGFVWGSQPGGAILVWVFDPTTSQYYQAYYYPSYGYYAWVSNPLVAVGEYSPQIAIVIH